MPSDETASARPELRFTSEFRRNLRQLAKKYRHIRSDIQPILDEISANQQPGDQITGLVMSVYKVRAANRDARKGKSGGYRIIYAPLTDATIILVTLYSKSEQQDINVQEIQAILNEFVQDTPAIDRKQIEGGTSC
jgi:mRNA-degrading endonuclease RelE of RelBE toxin-antitoxin system